MKGGLKLNIDWNSLLDIGVRLLGGLAILILGVIVAKIISGAIRKVLTKNKFIKEKLMSKFDKSEDDSFARVISKVVYYIIMIFVLIAAFQFWNLAAVTTPLNTVLNSIFEYLPLIGGALILAVIAWIVATILKKLIIALFSKSNFDKKVSEQFDKGKETTGLGNTIAELVYYLVFLLFLPAILGTLKLGGILSPVQNMVDIFLAFIPNLFAAAIILAIGIFISKFVKNIVVNLLKAMKVDEFGKSEGITPEGKETSLSELLGTIVYFVILIPIIISALNILNLESIALPATGMLVRIFNFMPALFSAIIIVAFAYFIGKIVGSLTGGILGKLGLDRIPSILGLKESKINLSELAGKLVMIAVILFAAIEAADVIGFVKVSGLIEKVVILATNVLIGVIIIGLGLYIANLISGIIRNSKAKSSKSLAFIAKAAILILAFTMGLSQMGLAENIIEYAFIFFVGAFAVSAAIAFGFGGRDWAANKIKEIEEKISEEE